jgi:ATP-binding cassette, subfamily B, bacterial
MDAKTGDLPTADAIDGELEEYLDEVAPTRIRAAEALDMGRFVLRFVFPHRRRVALVVVLLLIDAMVEMAFPLASRWLIDDGLIGKDGVVVAIVLGYLAIAATLGTALGILCDYLEAGILADVVRDIRQRLFDHLQAQPWRFFQGVDSGQILSRFSGDVVALEGVLVSFSTWVILPAIEICYAFFLMFYFSVWLGLIGSLLFVAVVVMPRFFANRAFALSYDKRALEGKLLGAVHENLLAQGVIKAFGLEEMARTRFGAINGRWRRTALRVNFFGSLVESTADGGVWLVHLAVFGLGAYWVFEGRLTVGTLVAFESMFLSMGHAMTYVMEFVPVLAEAGGSVRHLDEFLSRPAVALEIAGATELPRLAGRIVFDKVGFRYAPKGFRIAELDLVVPFGSHVVVVGPSGAGKSTLLALLLRLYEPTEGRITFDDRDISQATIASLRGQIGVVFQESLLFEGSIGDNIALGNPDADRAMIEAAAKAAEIHDHIVSLPHGYDTLVGERGSKLSVGQRQRIAIARALVRDPTVLLLDEATSALDHETEAQINATLRRLAGRRTIISVTHRIAAAAQADLIVVMERGRIRDVGSHAKLAAGGGFYGEYWQRHQRRNADTSEG